MESRNVIIPRVQPVQYFISRAREYTSFLCGNTKRERYVIIYDTLGAPDAVNSLIFGIDYFASTYHRVTIIIYVIPYSTINYYSGVPPTCITVRHETLLCSISISLTHITCETIDYG